VLPALVILVALFALLFVARIGAARRAQILARWPALVLAAAALFALARAAIWPATGLAALAALAWTLGPRMSAPTRNARGAPGEAEARAVLGVGPQATEAEIRQAYREKMARAHPDRGGRHADAARLTAARDLLLKKRT
jgi:hypothetical protein